jgi:hypothetical protein
LDAGDREDASLDDDGDGFSSLEEYLAGTDPRDGRSFLRVESISRAANISALRFIALSNRTYTVECCDSLPARAWSRVTDVTAAPTNRLLDVLDSGSDGTRQRFYRILCPREP